MKNNKLFKFMYASFSKLRVDYYNASFSTKKLFLNCTSIKK